LVLNWYLVIGALKRIHHPRQNADSETGQTPENIEFPIDPAGLFRDGAEAQIFAATMALHYRY
jgi:hypothetical protein